MVKYIKQKKGITLIALVITIIVLLILAGISISMLTGDNSILQKATDAKTNTDNANEKEQIQLAVLGSYNESTELEIETLNSNIKNNISGVTTDEATEFPLTVTYTATGNSYTVDENGIVKNNIPNNIEITPIYAKLYDNNVLILSAINNYIDSERTLTYDFGKIENKSETNYYSQNNYSKNITKIIIHDEIVPETAAYMFANLYNVAEIENISNINTEKTSSMESMFYNCKNLTNLNLNSFNTSNVTNMNSMFCMSFSEYDEIPPKLTSLNLDNFDTKNVTNMEYMFSSCVNLTSLDLSSFSTEHVTNMSNMFYMGDNGLPDYDGSKLSTIFVSELWSTNNVTSSSRMFQNLYNIVGQNGTKYNSNYRDKTYARLDTITSPGYFTFKNN